MPVVQPADLWKETGRWYQIGPEMARFSDRNERDMVLAMTHEEVVADLVRREVAVLQASAAAYLPHPDQVPGRTAPTRRVDPGAGIHHERQLQPGYRLDGLDKQYRRHYQAYFNIYHRCGLPVIAVNSDTGMMGGKLAHEYMYLNPIGEDTLILCDHCGYSANRQVARFQKAMAVPEKLLPIQKVHTPTANPSKIWQNFLGLPKSRTAKAVFFMATIPQDPKGLDRPLGSNQELFIFAVIRVRWN